MTPAEEDALVKKFWKPGAYVPEAMRLAIRAAVAHERERAARACETGAPGQPIAYALAAAIRRGE